MGESPLQCSSAPTKGSMCMGHTPQQWAPDWGRPPECIEPLQSPQISANTFASTQCLFSTFQPREGIHGHRDTWLPPSSGPTHLCLRDKGDFCLSPLLNPLWPGRQSHVGKVLGVHGHLGGSSTVAPGACCPFPSTASVARTALRHPVQPEPRGTFFCVKSCLDFTLFRPISPCFSANIHLASLGQRRSTE